MLDRIDIFSFVNPVSYKEINKNKSGETSEKIKKRIEAARIRQKERYKDDNIYTNSALDQRLLKKYIHLNSSCKKLFENIFNKNPLSTRSYSKILKISKTIADLDEREDIKERDIIEAANYRSFVDEVFS